MQLFYSKLPEKSQRHYAALEALKFGYGGKAYITRLLDVNHLTLNRGIRELSFPDLESILPDGKQRMPGGGRKKKRFISPPFETNSMN